MRSPNFDNLLKVLRREAPDRPTLFEFFLNAPLYRKVSGFTGDPAWGMLDWARMAAVANIRIGYDYAAMMGTTFGFPAKTVESQASRSMNETAVIFDRASFDAYEWPDPDAFDYSGITTLASELPSGAKVIVWGPGGVLENVMQLAGYEGLCYMIADDPVLVEDIFAEVGSRLRRYYELCAREQGIGAMISNDDWGFKSQTMLQPSLMRKYVFPWHVEIAQTIHAGGYPAILHSCGNLESVMDDIIDTMRYDGKHSYEDTICPVEEMYEKYHERIAIMGGLDVDFVCRSTPAEVHARAMAMVARSATRGGYALGTGNSVPAYVPDENYFAMTSAATGFVPATVHVS
ncbi:MAG TPA: uroporphyrinogen decarboxylase family protein [Capsulimonadaceae bacterium]